MEESFFKSLRKKLQKLKHDTHTVRTINFLNRKNYLVVRKRIYESPKTRIFSGLLLASISLIAFWPSSNEKNKIELATPVVEEVPPYFGIPAKGLQKEEYFIKNGETFSTILEDHQIPVERLNEVIDAARSKIDLRTIRPGQLLSFVHKDTSGTVSNIIYKPNIFKYYNIAIEQDTIQVAEVIKQVDLVDKTASGVIESSLWNAMKASGASDELSDYLADVLAWTVDFYHVHKGDKFKVVYTEKQIDGVPVGVANISAAVYSQLGEDNYVIKYENENYDEYYDLEGRPSRRAFLKAPVKYSRISSRYSRRRFHPVLKRHKAHLGTDYAAPRGTPVYATANGVITKAGYARNNGNYVKIKHNDIYSTQYLHFHKIAKGIRKGKPVTQGQVIGYVGSTGLATGPHVCYRFWKNGRQVDPYRQKLPSPPPMKSEDLPDYFVVRDSLKSLLDAIPEPTLTPNDPDDVITAAANP